jgi:hypothetical protein
VENVATILAFLRKLIFLALVGLLAVVLIGPVLAVVGVLASFALIGLMVWLPIRYFVGGQPVEWDRVREKGRHYCGVVMRGCQRFGGGVWNYGHGPMERLRATGRFLAAVCRETLCGTILGAMLGLIHGSQDGFHLQPLILGICLGAVIGAFVGLMSRPRLREAA